jgi:hypothetical protein
MGSILSALLAFALSGGAPSPRVENVTLSGKVVELTDALKDFPVRADAEPLAAQVVLRATDGSLTPLLSDDASRALFLDKRLRDRPIEIKGRRYDGLPYLQVTTFRVEEDGKLRTPEYYCEICSIRVRYPQICPCCQGPMELRMKPEER